MTTRRRRRRRDDDDDVNDAVYNDEDSSFALWLRGGKNHKQAHERSKKLTYFLYVDQEQQGTPTTHLHYRHWLD